MPSSSFVIVSSLEEKVVEEVAVEEATFARFGRNPSSRSVLTHSLTFVAEAEEVHDGCRICHQI